jgi:hypothetical protein
MSDFVCNSQVRAVRFWLLQHISLKPSGTVKDGINVAARGKLDGCSTSAAREKEQACDNWCLTLRDRQR